MSDVLVIGGGISGLTAAAYLARAGRSVTLLEASDAPGGLCRDIQLDNGWTAPGAAHLLYALDPQVVKDLRLARHGLRFAQRDLALTGLRADGGRLTLTRDVHETARQLTPLSEADAAGYVEFRRGILEPARKLRSLWWQGRPLNADAALHQLAVTGAAALLNSQFETEALKALLAFDATAGGLSVQEPGSALALVWRLAQEVGGLQGAVALPQGGMSGVTQAVMAAALKAGAVLRSHAEVKHIMAEGGQAAGVQLASGEIFMAPLILSSLPLAQTLALLPPGAAGLAPVRRTQAATGEAKLVLALSRMPELEGRPFGTRFVTAERLEILIAAHANARAGYLPYDTPCEFIIVPAPDGGAILSMQARPVPLAGWAAHGARLTERLLAQLEPTIPGLRSLIMAQTVMPPEEMGAPLPLPSVAQMLASPRARVTTPLRGLYLCGASCEPVPSVSGRAARFAAALALKGAP